MSPFNGVMKRLVIYILLIYIVYYNGCFTKKIEHECMKLYNSTQNNLIAENVDVANSFFTRTLGLIPKNAISDNEGLIIKPCCSVHTFFMKFSIDVLFINRKNEVIALYENVRPYRILPVHFTSSYVIELCANQISRTNVNIGDIISIEEDRTK